MSDLATITSVAGLFGFAVALVFPLALGAASKRALDCELGPGHTRTAHTTAVTASPVIMSSITVFSWVVTALTAAGLAFQLLAAPLHQLMDKGGEWP